MTQLAQMFDALGLPPAIQEPEVAARELSHIRARSLAHIIAALVNENEPMLKAEADGATVTVNERGSGATMRFTIDAGVVG